MFWKWKELCVTHSEKRYNQFRRALADEGIDHRSRASSRLKLLGRRGRPPIGPVGDREEFLVTYAILVRPADLERARHIIHHLPLRIAR